ncbi:MAG: hypothetical protein P4L84_34855 [Isosphaeraceae bacterium]|nr:hypothetical protein [Isosphaeraceae bacterium]
MSKKPKSPVPPEHGGKPTPTHDLEAEETRSAQESAHAKDAEASIRDRMVNIGRGNKQAGRQGQ